jgi:hypothetical protein
VDFKKVVSFDQINTLFFLQSARNNPRQLEPGERIRTFEEVNGGLTSGGMEDEISRCFKCGTCIDCENCLDFCPDLSILKDTELRFYGFDFFASQSLTGGRTAAQVPHDFTAERAFAKALMARDSRFSLRAAPQNPPL